MNIELMNIQAKPLDETYLLSQDARLALFFAKLRSTSRNTDHITLEDIVYGAERVTKKDF
jgi:hypothetical protein